MSTLAERDRLIRESWIKVQFRRPASDPRGDHFPVAVHVVVDDPRYRVNGDEPFEEKGAYWPALDKFTVTHSCAADQEARDIEVNVTYWQPLMPLPWG